VLISACDVINNGLILSNLRDTNDGGDKEHLTFNPLIKVI